MGGRVILLTTPTETNSGRETRARVVFASLRLSSLCVLVYIYAREKHSEIPDNTSAFSLYSRHDTECGARSISFNCRVYCWRSGVGRVFHCIVHCSAHTRVRNAIVVRRKGQSMVVLPSRQGLDVESSEIVFSGAGGGYTYYTLLPTAVNLGDLHLENTLTTKCKVEYGFMSGFILTRDERDVCFFVINPTQATKVLRSLSDLVYTR